MAAKAKRKVTDRKTVRYTIEVNAVAELPTGADEEAYFREIGRRLAAINPEWTSFRVAMSKAAKANDTVLFSNTPGAGGPASGGRGPSGGTTTTTTTTTTTLIPSPTPRGGDDKQFEARIRQILR